MRETDTRQKDCPAPISYEYQKYNTHNVESRAELVAVEVDQNVAGGGNKQQGIGYTPHGLFGGIWTAQVAGQVEHMTQVLVGSAMPIAVPLLPAPWQSLPSQQQPGRGT